MSEPGGDLFREDQHRRGWSSKLRRGLRRSRTRLAERLDAAVSGRQQVDEDALMAIEEALIASDVGVETSLELVDRLRRDPLPGQGVDLLALRSRLVQEMTLLLRDLPSLDADVVPRVDVLVGVNGVGKTTTMAKLAQRGIGRGESVLLVAADTFRAAAIEQTQVWGDRLQLPVVAREQGADAGAVVFEGLQRASACGIDRVVVDTAGRLHTRAPLMQELEKVVRIVQREAAERKLARWLVLDATTGQNVLAQAREFGHRIDVDGLILAKTDGTAKGGMAVAVAQQLKLPVGFLGVGEAAEDLIAFDPGRFAEELLGYDLQESVEP